MAYYIVQKISKCILQFHSQKPYYRSLGQCSCLTEIIRNHIAIKQRKREDRFRNIMERFRRSYEAMAKEDENEEGWE